MSVEGGPVETTKSWWSGITAGNVVSWVLIVAAAGMAYGQLGAAVSISTETNLRQDMQIEALKIAVQQSQLAMSDIRGDIRVINQNIANIMDSLKRMETQRGR